MVLERQGWEWIGNGWDMKTMDEKTGKVKNRWLSVSIGKAIQPGEKIAIFKQDEEKLKQQTMERKGRDLTPNDPRWVVMRKRGGYFSAKKEEK